MFEGIKVRRLKNELELESLNLELSQMKALSGIVNEAELPAKIVQPESDEDEWTLLNNESIGRSLSDEDQLKLKEKVTEAYYKTPHGRNIIRLLEKYVAGRGFSIDPKSSLPQVKEVWDNFWKMNNMEMKKKEIVRRSARDGDCFIRYFEDRGETIIRFMIAQKVENPEDERGKDPDGIIESGIETDKDDIENVLAYWYKGTRIPAEEVQHIKLLVDSDIRRGRSLLEPVIQYLYMYADWLKDRLKLNKIRATMGIVKHVKGTTAQAANIKSANDTTQRLNPDGTAKQRMPAGVSVYTANQNVDYDFKTPNLQASDVSADGRTLLIAIAAGMGLPEFMVTSDASNGNFACYDENTEVLTDHGWKYFKDIIGTEFIATIKPETMELEYQSIIKNMSYEYSGMMYKIQNKHTDLMITPNHKMYISTRHNRMDLYKFREIKDVKSGFIIGGVIPNNIGKEIDYMILPEISYSTHPELNKGNRTINYDDWLEFLGYFISEGCIHKQQGKFTIGISQTKPHIRKKIIQNLNRLPFKYKDTPTSFYIHDKSLWTWLFNNCGERSETRKVPDINMSNRQLTILLNALMDGDGHYPVNRSVKYYYSTSPILIDQVQDLCVRLGYATTKTTLYESTIRQDGFERLKMYKLSIRKQKECSIKKSHIEKCLYNGKVYCLEVPNHTLVVRRNGKVCICGNSTMVAEGPAVMEFEDWQDFFGIHYLMMFERVIKTAIQANLIPAFETVTEKEIKVEPDGKKTIIEKEVVYPTDTEASIVFPDLITRDIKAETEALILQKNNQWVSDHTAMSRLDYNYDDERELMRQEEEAEDFDSGEPTDEEKALMEEPPENADGSSEQEQDEGEDNIPETES